MATIDSLNARIAKLQAQAEVLRKKQSAGVIAQIQRLMKEHGLTVDDLGRDSGSKSRGTEAKSESNASARYRDPKSGAEWSGRGRAPGWIANAKNRNRFLIDGNAASATGSAEKAPAKAGNYVRGPQPAKYRDPKSGATWSGRGKAPAWLAGAKDRNKFLIDAAEADTQTQSSGGKGALATARKKGAAKKSSATAKKAPAKRAAAANKTSASARKPASKKATAKKAARKAAPGAAMNGANGASKDASGLGGAEQAV
ncbi:MULTISPECIES: H-NS family nucleoid-associated regulatory protein [unclassified Caballeronia]|uniref:H-NS family nucleoid-associated regulatory protein n=1 Tax=unclassified Caballeronia TaxID=2646786 RepID=UPI00285662CE|nr:MULTISPECIES: H-NS family nucleoid-associated regulatory protein [unclassified Caballeronia]MDR5741256.1 H-NS family nucleoid-associated regulatory protein [Caballeronia sp. LZ016]MDR5807154.1 H-NS family nucleoid-associated regulatory protein [Caballeronia sp. LZ019]